MFRDMLARAVEAVSAWSDPMLRHQRALSRARDVGWHRTTLAAGLAAATAVLLPYGGGPGLPDAGWAAAAAVSAVSAVRAWRRLAELRDYVPPPAQPRLSSSVRPAVDRLSHAASTLRALLARLGSLASGTAEEAAAAELSLRELAARVDALDAALSLAPPEAHAGLREARAMLLVRLDDGAQAYEWLVAAAAECVAAGAGGPGDAFARRRLHEATDRLRGLAAGTQEVHEIGWSAGLGRS